MEIEEQNAINLMEIKKKQQEVASWRKNNFDKAVDINEIKKGMPEEQ